LKTFNSIEDLRKEYPYAVESIEIENKMQFTDARFIVAGVGRDSNDDCIIALFDISHTCDSDGNTYNDNEVLVCLLCDILAGEPLVDEYYVIPKDEAYRQLALLT